MTAQPLALPSASDVLDVVAAAERTRGLPDVVPWRIAVTGDEAEVWAVPRLDESPAERRVRHLLAGCIIPAAEVTARARGCRLDVDLVPDPAQPRLLAHWSIGPGERPTIEDVQLAVAVELTSGHVAGGARRLVHRLVRLLRADALAHGTVLEPGPAEPMAGATLLLTSPADRPIDWLRAGWALGMARLRAAAWGAKLSVSYDVGGRTARTGVPLALLRVGGG